MATTQTTPEAAQQAAQPSILDTIVQNTDARMQAEAARADALTAKTYSQDSNAYAIAMGRDLGLKPALALQLIHIIGGKPALSAGARAMFLKQAGYDWRPVKHDDTVCTLRFWRNGEPMVDVEGKPLDVTITFADAERAGWVQNARGSGKVGNWDKIPRNMLHARVISNFHRWYAPEVCGAQIYDAGEITLESVIDATEQRVFSKSNDAMDALKERLAVASAPVAEVVNA